MQAGQHVTPTIRLVRLLGEGAMGCVWAAEHLALGTLVAVKLMTRDYAQRPDLTVRFRREAQAAAQLRSPHVTQVLDYGVTPEGEPYIVMELLEGETLRQRLQRVGYLPLDQVVQLVEQTAKTLSRAHQLGIVHRDIKPDNLFLIDVEGDPFVKALDFGIAKQVQANAMGMTSTGALLGTPFYMSPEQFNDAKDIDHRTDLWALSVVAYQALTGRLPFTGDTIWALALSVHAGNFAPPSTLRSELPATVDAWMGQALHRECPARFGTAMELVDALKTAASRAAPGVGAGRWAAVSPPGAPSIAFADTARDPAQQPEGSLPAVQRNAAVKPMHDGAPAVPERDAHGRAEPRARSGMDAAFDLGAIRRIFSHAVSTSESPQCGVTPGGDEPPIEITHGSWEDAEVLSVSMPRAKPSAIAFDERGAALYSSFKSGMVLCWDVEARRLRWWRHLLARPLCLGGARGSRWLAVGGDDGNIRLVDAENGQTAMTLQGHGAAVRGVAMSPGGQQLASCSDDKTVRLWSVPAGECLHIGKEHSDRVRSVAFSPDGAVLASGGNDGTVRLWDPELRPLWVVRGPPNGVRSVAFAPNCVLAAGCGDGTIRLWEIGKHKPIRILKGHMRVVSVAFGGDGDVLASGSPDCSVRLWDVATGKVVRVLSDHARTVESVAMSPDGRHVASASEDGMVRLFRFSVPFGRGPHAPLGDGARR